jgi:hypothetical protein
MPVNALSAMVSMRTTMESLLTIAPPRVNPTDKSQHSASSASATEDPAAARSSSSSREDPRASAVIGDAHTDEDASPPFDRSYYILTPAEMIDHNYPVPVEDGEGGLRCPEGYVATQPAIKSADDSGHDAGNDAGDGGAKQFFSLLAVDCEMCYTEKGLELTRATFLSESGLVVYDQLVLPPRPITDFNTRHSGITAAAMHGVTTSIKDVQAWLLANVTSETLLVGHALENDLRALKVLHSRVRVNSVSSDSPQWQSTRPFQREAPSENATRALPHRVMARAAVSQATHVFRAGEGGKDGDEPMVR